MKKVEVESLLKSFFLFFISQSVLISALLYLDYRQELKILDDGIFSKMRICSLDLSCSEYSIDFEESQKYELYKLYKDSKSLSSYFPIAGSKKNILKIYLQKKQYEIKVEKVTKKFMFKFLFVTVVVIILSLLFALYALSPLRNALNLTQEFIKDILHDFNTPLATLRLNVAMLEDENKKSKKLQRIKNSVQTILSLQSNLRAYLHNHTSEIEVFELQELLKERVTLMEENYRDLKYSFKLQKVYLKTNKEAFIRILDNLISNASKYNKKNGVVDFNFNDKILEIKDSGKGIKNPSKIFERFYKEQNRGIGIGLNIVKKLSEEIYVRIYLKSTIDVGTSFYLDLSKIMK